MAMLRLGYPQGRARVPVIHRALIDLAYNRISIGVDEDVLNYFKKQGSGYQRRMNAVLRFCVEQKRRKRA
jgi:uncharacterized protein (DUF4415 family)